MGGRCSSNLTSTTPPRTETITPAVNGIVLLFIFSRASPKPVSSNHRRLIHLRVWHYFSSVPSVSWGPKVGQPLSRLGLSKAFRPRRRSVLAAALGPASSLEPEGLRSLALS